MVLAEASVLFALAADGIAQPGPLTITYRNDSSQLREGFDSPIIDAVVNATPGVYWCHLSSSLTSLPTAILSINCKDAANSVQQLTNFYATRDMDLLATDAFIRLRKAQGRRKSNKVGITVGKYRLCQIILGQLTCFVYVEQ
jgi:hypothetical protein